jgi:hypothetical protein
MGRETTAQKRDSELLEAVYRRSLRRFAQRVGAVEESSWRGKPGDKFHGVLSHLAVAEENGLQLIRASLAGRVALAPSSDGRASEADLMGGPATGLLALIEQVVEEQLRILKRLPDDGLLETPAVVPEWSRPGNLGRLYDHLYVHLVFHYEELRSEVGDPPLLHWFDGWMPEASNDFYDRLFRLLPVLYTPEAAEGSESKEGSICIDLTQPGGGRWTVVLDHSEAHSVLGCEGVTTTTIKANPRAFFDYLRDEGRRVKIRGNGTAARNLRALFPLS